jgi:DNA-binding response OmpR family regulator
MKPNICIIEDDEDAQTLLKNGLRKAGFSVTAYGNGFPVLEMLSNLPDVFLLDIDLPGVDGLAVCKWLKTQPSSRNIPVVFLSGKPFLKDLIADTACDDFIQKPFQFDDLVNKVNTCLTRC